MPITLHNTPKNTPWPWHCWVIAVLGILLLAHGLFIGTLSSISTLFPAYASSTKKVFSEIQALLSWKTVWFPWSLLWIQTLAFTYVQEQGPTKTIGDCHLFLPSLLRFRIFRHTMNFNVRASLQFILLITFLLACLQAVPWIQPGLNLSTVILIGLLATLLPSLPRRVRKIRRLSLPLFAYWLVLLPIFFGICIVVALLQQYVLLVAPIPFLSKNWLVQDLAPQKTLWVFSWVWWLCATTGLAMGVAACSRGRSWLAISLVTLLLPLTNTLFTMLPSEFVFQQGHLCFWLATMSVLILLCVPTVTPISFYGLVRTRHKRPLHTMAIVSLFQTAAFLCLFLWSSLFRLPTFIGFLLSIGLMLGILVMAWALRGICIEEKV